MTSSYEPARRSYSRSPVRPYAGGRSRSRSPIRPSVGGGRDRSRSPYARRRYSRSPVDRRRRDDYRERSRERYGRDSRDSRDRYSNDRRDRFMSDRRPPREPRERRPIYRGTEEERLASKTLFIGNLPFNYEERDVSHLMERFGALRKVTIPFDRFTRRNRGFCFVEFEERRDAEDAMQKYQGYAVEGRELRVDWDVGSERKPRFESGSSAPSREPRNDDRRGDDFRARDRSRSPSRSRSPVPRPSDY